MFKGYTAGDVLDLIGKERDCAPKKMKATSMYLQTGSLVHANMSSRKDKKNSSTGKVLTRE